ncbi:MAG: hemerythrin domain-containing protein [Rhodocyclaceae bacterium]|nr:hemerythrin domain-containing protein [Rhodocyclaceae bacterium]MCL4758343.1 hemerythrin domain-containing protein [Rhodocyclaceae bacterium]
MASITDLMTHDHRECDEVFARIEQAVSKGDWDGAATALRAFTEALEAHFGAEENTLFPSFEAATGMTDGPTRMMRMEHAEMRRGLEAMQDALARKDADDLSGEAETLLILMQQHNMKEENILYPMCDGHLSGQAATLAPRLKDQLKGSAV